MSIPIDEFKFWSQVDIKSDDQCWEWKGKKMYKGYGYSKGIRKPWEFSHRTAFEFKNGPIPTGMYICHKCDNPPCCNPSHLWAGTQKENLRDRREKGRSASGFKNGMHTKPLRRAFGERNGHSTHPEKTPRGDNHHARRNPIAMARGERVGLAKLTEEAVQDIRSNHIPRKVPSIVFAKKYGVSTVTIDAVVHYRTWKHVA